MTLTSTYDHRIIQGAESGLFLARMEELLRGDDGFYERDLRGPEASPHRPVRWEIDVTPGLFGPAGSDEVDREAGAASCSSSAPTACAATSWPTSTPSTRARAPHEDLDPATYGLTLWDLDREFITDGLAGQATRPRCARSSTCCATPTAARSASSTCTSRSPSARTGCRTAWRRTRNRPPLDAAGAPAHPGEAGGGGELRALPAREIRRPQALLAGGLRDAHPAARPRPQRRRARAGVQGGRDRHGPPRPPQRAGQHDRQAAGPDLLGVRGQRRPDWPRRARAT